MKTNKRDLLQKLTEENLRKGGLFVLFFFLLSFLQTTGTVVFCQISFTIFPLIQEITAPPGATRDFRLRVITGPSEREEMHFLVYPADFRLTKEGEIEFFESGSIKRSAAPWIKIDPAEFTMKPNERKETNVKLTVPQNVSGGYYAAILVHLIPEVPPEMKIVTTIRTWRMASIVELTVTGWKRPRAKIGISELKVEPSSEGRGLAFTTTIQNKGNVHARGEGSLTITTREGRRLAELPLKAGRGTVFPESMRDFKAVLERELPSGEYFVDATFRYENRRARAKISFSVGEAPTEGEVVAKKKEINFSVNPPVVGINAPPGSIRTINLIITNEENQPVHFRLYFKDIRIDPDGEIALLEKGSTSWSSSNWIELKVSEFELGPLQRKNIVGLLKIPKDVAGGRYTRLVVEASLAQAKTGEKISTLVPQTTIMVTVGDKLERKGEISEFRFLQTNGGSPEFLVRFKNTGDVHLIVKGGITLKNWIGDTVAELPFSEGEAMVLPGGARNFTTSPAEPLKAGRYKARVTFLSQNKELVTTTKEITVAE